jgi:hypothetical protein
MKLVSCRPQQDLRHYFHLHQGGRVVELSNDTMQSFRGGSASAMRGEHEDYGLRILLS